MYEWLRSTRAKLSQKSAVAGAINYGLGRWPAFVRYCDDGALEIDNNAANAASGISRVMPRPGLCRVGPQSIRKHGVARAFEAA
jgi:hypothetical protein